MRAQVVGSSKRRWIDGGRTKGKRKKDNRAEKEEKLCASKTILGKEKDRIRESDGEISHIVGGIIKKKGLEARGHQGPDNPKRN